MSLMILGTASHVGKSITVAAICRCLANRNVCVAPFKSQNMSLNSYVTADGAEIGIAQAMQAHAARAEPVADMNPVLLKPKGDMTSQVVLLGRPYCDVRIGDYYKKTDHLLTEATAAYRRLEGQYGNIVVEGAGGAAELNLYDRDIANILLAYELRLPVILVADIERGGVFAQVYGTIKLLPDEIRSLVKGIIINKFRGDPALFQKGVEKIEELTGVPVLGVVPYADIPLPSEDSLSIGDKKGLESPVHIAIIRLPRISNFTDFELLERYASVDYVAPGMSLDGYDCIIIPGTKNTVEDLRCLRETGCADAIIRARKQKIPVIGICGGYQMLGREIRDAGIESEAGCHRGLGLLDAVTVFDAYRKTTKRVKRCANPVSPILSGIGEVEGYEIHMGDTVVQGMKQAFEGEGAVTDDGLVFGTYLHGLFQDAQVTDALLGYLYELKGETFDGVSGKGEFTDSAYDALAEHFEENIDIDTIMQYFSYV